MNLEIEIPEKFKEGLSDRFNYHKAEYWNNGYRIHKSCPLCMAYYFTTFPPSCKDCPFVKFKGNYIISGCMKWIDDVLEERPRFDISFYYIYYSMDDKWDAEWQLDLLREKAIKLIKWTKEEK